ncbi:RNA polymerase alpha subunit C-terminal domain-containing protein [Sphingobacterium nematocida]|nr:RNA polymerase alpha subunit C-terminal domain-containing protein [Sphingobacterium nematocida]
MEMPKGTLRTCPDGHAYYKSSDCPVCPQCEAAKKPQSGFLSTLSAPARRALTDNGINTLQQLSNYSEKELLQLHGFGKRSIPKLQQALEKENLDFKR